MVLTLMAVVANILMGSESKAATIILTVASVGYGVVNDTLDNFKNFRSIRKSRQIKGFKDNSMELGKDLLAQAAAFIMFAACSVLYGVLFDKGMLVTSLIITGATILPVVISKIGVVAVNERAQRASNYIEDAERGIAIANSKQLSELTKFYRDNLVAFNSLKDDKEVLEREVEDLGKNIDKLNDQKDSFELRVKQMSEHYAQQEVETNTRIEGQNAQIDALNTELSSARRREDELSRDNLMYRTEIEHLLSFGLAGRVITPPEQSRAAEAASSSQDRLTHAERVVWSRSQEKTQDKGKEKA